MEEVSGFFCLFPSAEVLRLLYSCPRHVVWGEIAPSLGGSVEVGGLLEVLLRQRVSLL